MKKLEDLIRQYDHADATESDIYIKTKLKIIRNLFEEIKGAEESIYMEEIISKFAEIMECQQDDIDSWMMAAAAADGYGPPKHNWVTASGKPIRTDHAPTDRPSCRLTADDIPWDPECESFEPENPVIPPSYLPPEGGFQSDEQVKKAFTNYLTHHVVRETKKEKVKKFSIHTIYDYSSRLKVLWQIACEEWNHGDWNRKNVVPGCTFLNAYNNIEILRKYVEAKDLELREIANGCREPLPADEARKNPLNNPRNLRNTMASLARFEEFKKSIEAQ